MSENNMPYSYDDSEKHAEVHSEHQHSDIAKEDVDLELKLDKHGLPLVPQPSRFKDDPLVRNFLVSAEQSTLTTLGTELARMAQVGRPDPGQLHGLLGPFQCRRYQP
jgi:hypothetical protein